MNDEPADGLAGSLRELASEARRRQGPDAHPSPETLTAYHAGELTFAHQLNKAGKFWVGRSPEPVRLVIETINRIQHNRQNAIGEIARLEHEQH